MGCMDSFDPDPRIAQALAAGGDAGPRWVTMDTYFYTLDHFLNAMDWHRSFLPPARTGVGLINSRRRGTKPDGLPLHNVSVQGWAARAHALHAANISHISIWLMPLSDEFLWCAGCERFVSRDFGVRSDKTQRRFFFITAALCFDFAIGDLQYRVRSRR